MVALVTGIGGTMKGKLAFVLGAAVGYVLGARAGRERYEQIKRRAEAVWNTEPVQRGVAAWRETVDGQIDNLKGFAKRVGADAVSNIAQKAGGGSRTSETASTGTSPAQAAATTKTAAPAPEPAATAAGDRKNKAKKPEAKS